MEIGSLGEQECGRGPEIRHCTIDIGRWGSAKGWDIVLDSKKPLVSPQRLILLVS